MRPRSSGAVGRTFEHRRAKVSRFLRLAAYLAHKHEHRSNLLSRLAFPRKISCHESPYLSSTHPYRSLNGYAPSGMRICRALGGSFPHRVDLTLRPAFHVE